MKSTKSVKRPYEYKATVGKDDFGINIRKSFYSSKSRKAAKEKALKYIEDQAIKRALGETADALETPKRKFSTIALQWLNVYKKGHVKNNTYYGTYENPVKKHLIPEFGNKEISKITHTEIQIFLNKKSKFYAEGSVRKMLACLHAIFETACEDRYISQSPAKGNFNFPKCKPSIKKHVYTKEQYDKVLALAKQDSNGCLDVWVLLETGISRSELLGIRFDNLHENKVLEIAQGTVEQKSTETNKLELVSDGLKNSYRKRMIPISSELFDALKRKPRTVSVSGKIVTPEYLFYSPRGTNWHPDNWYKRVYLPFMDRMHLEYPDIPILHPHELRHTRATLWKEEGVDDFYIMKMCGWANDRMFNTRYGHFNPEIAREKLHLK